MYIYVKVYENLFQNVSTHTPHQQVHTLTYFLNGDIFLVNERGVPDLLPHEST